MSNVIYFLCINFLSCINFPLTYFCRCSFTNVFVGLSILGTTKDRHIDTISLRNEKFQNRNHFEEAADNDELTMELFPNSNNKHHFKTPRI